MIKTKEQLINEQTKLRKRLLNEKTQKHLSNKQRNYFVQVTMDTERSIKKQADEISRKAKDYSDNIIESSLDPIVVTDSNGYITRANKSFLKLLDYKEKEVIGKQMSEFAPIVEGTYESITGESVDINNKYLDNIKTMISTLIKEEKLSNWEDYYLRKDKKLIPVEHNMVYLYDEKGNKIGVVGISREITERKRTLEMIEGINNCFLSFSANADENINKIIQTTASTFRGLNVLFNKEGDLLYALEDWNVPDKSKQKDRKKDDIYHDIITKNEGKPFVIDDFDKTPYAKTDPNITKYRIKTCIGCVVNIDEKPIGVLCVFYQENKTFNLNELNVLSILAKAIGIEEERKKALNELKYHQQMLQISEKNLKEFSRRMLSVREEEKKKLSISLHDEVGSLGVSLGSNLDIAEEEIKENNMQGALKRITHSKILLNRSLENLKNMSVDLRPPNLDSIGLPNILKEYFSNISSQTKIKINFTTNLNEKKLSDEVAIALYRVAQEALNNIVKYAKAKKAMVRLNFNKNTINLTIHDDGQGFDCKKMFRKSTAMGIRGMKERVESLKGTFNINSTHKEGTEIIITLPL